MHLTTFHAGVLFDDAQILDGFEDTVALEHTDVAVRELAAPEPDGHLDLVAFSEETPSVAHLDIEVVLVGLGAELDLLDADGHLLLAGGSLLLLAFVLESSVVDESADRGASVGSHFDEIVAALSGHIQGVLGEELPQLGARLVDDQNTGNTNSLVYAGFVSLGGFVEVSPASPQGLSDAVGTVFRLASPEWRRRRGGLLVLTTAVAEDLEKARKRSGRHGQD